MPRDIWLSAGFGFICTVGAVMLPNLPIEVGIAGLVIGVLFILRGLWLWWEERAAARAVDYAAWDDREAFQLYEAACLWVEERPILPMSRKAQRLYDRWREMIYAGTLKRTGELTVDEAVNLAMERSEHFDRPRTSITPHTLVKRSSLVELAEAAGEAPRFLFPYRRGERG